MFFSKSVVFIILLVEESILIKTIVGHVFLTVH